MNSVELYLFSPTLFLDIFLEGISRFSWCRRKYSIATFEGKGWHLDIISGDRNTSWNVFGGCSAVHVY